MHIIRWSILKSDRLYFLQPKEILHSQKKGDWDLTVAQILIATIRLKSKKVGKTTRSFRYDLNRFPYNYTVEVRNRFKGLDLTDRVPEEL